MRQVVGPFSVQRLCLVPSKTSTPPCLMMFSPSTSVSPVFALSCIIPNRLLERENPPSVCISVGGMLTSNPIVADGTSPPSLPPPVKGWRAVESDALPKQAPQPATVGVSAEEVFGENGRPSAAWPNPQHKPVAKRFGEEEGTPTGGEVHRFSPRRRRWMLDMRRRGRSRSLE